MQQDRSPILDRFPELSAFVELLGFWRTGKNYSRHNGGPKQGPFLKPLNTIEVLWCTGGFLGGNPQLGPDDV